MPNDVRKALSTQFEGHYGDETLEIVGPVLKLLGPEELPISSFQGSKKRA